MKELILATILIAGGLAQSNTGLCVLRAIAGTDFEYAFDHHEGLLREVMRDFELLPSALQEQLKACLHGDHPFSDSCERKFGLNGCENHGFLRVKKCDLGFKRIDAGLCAEVCPPETTADAGGALCAKPKVTTRSGYKDRVQCLTHHEVCEEAEDRWVAACPPLYKPLGPTMCAYACPTGFVDTPEHCVPRLTHTPEYFIPQMRLRAANGLTGMQG